MMFTTPAVIVVFLMVSLLHSIPHVQSTSSSTYSCMYNYTLRADDTCMRSSRDDYVTCTDFSSFLGSLNGPSNCFHLSLEPGEYFLSNDYAVSMTTSVVISSTAGQNVKIACEGLKAPSTTQSTGEYENAKNFVPLTFKRRADNDMTFVALEGISFEKCNRPLEFNELDSLSVVNCTFRDFRASAIDIFNVDNIEIHDCLFNNCTTNIGKGRFRGNSGAVSIAYYSSDTEVFSPSRSLVPVASISGSTFSNNRNILPPGQSRFQLIQALNDNIYYGRGGGVGVFLQEFSLRNVSFAIEDCLFDRNYAESFGGGAYLYVAGSNTHHNFTVKDCNFTRNVCGIGSLGGGLQLAMLIQNLNSPPSRFEFIGCNFEENTADVGGGLSTVQVYSQGSGNLVTVSDCTFVNNIANNVGSAVMFASFLYVQNRNESFHYMATNNLFSNNSSPGGTFGIGFISVNFEGYNTFKFNNGPGLRIVGSQVVVSSGGSLSFVGNNAENQEGGALYVQDFGQIKLYSNSSMEFVNNTGRIGSAIVVNVQQSSPVFSQLIFNPQCFLIHETSSLAPGDWNDVSIRFSGNHASVGPAVYISHLDHCSWYSAVRVNNVTNEINATFTIGLFPNWAVFDYDENSNIASSLKADPTSARYYFQTEPVKIISRNETSLFPIRPGEQSRLNLEGIDQFGNPAYIIVRLSDSRSAINSGAFSQAGSIAIVNSTDPDHVQFEPALLPIQPSDGSVIITYGFPSLSREQFHEGEVIRIILDTPYNVKTSEQLFLNLSFVPCQPGFELRNRTDGDRLVSCLCVRDDFDILNCEEDVIILRDGHWAGDEDEPFPHLDLTVCPASYCRCHYAGGQTCQTLFFQNDPTFNLQCHPLRNGTLCGRCINGTSVGVLRTNCRECNKENYYALGFLVVGDILLVGLILLLAVKFHMIFPPSLKGFAFYIQTAYYTTEHFPITFWNIRRYMLYMSSSLGLYFPWDFCLFPSMTALVSFTPKFTPAAIATIISTIAIVCVYVTRSRNGREYIWHGIWTLVLLLYAPLVHTCVLLLNCPNTPSVIGKEENYHWYLDGEVKCFQDPGHIVLGIVAVLVLTCLVLLVPAVFIFTAVASSKKIQSRSRTIGWLYSALTTGYRDSWETKWWSSYELLRRLLLIVIAVSLPGRSVANLYVILNILAIHLFLKPYKKLWQNVMETVVLLCYTLVMLIRATPTFLDTLSSYTGTEIPENSGGDLTITDDVTWLLFPFFYLPVLIGIIFSIAALIYIIVRRIKDAKVRRNYKLRVKAYRASEGRLSSGNIQAYDDDYHEYLEDVHARSPDFTRTDFGLDELVDNKG